MTRNDETNLVEDFQDRLDGRLLQSCGRDIGKKGSARSVVTAWENEAGGSCIIGPTSDLRPSPGMHRPVHTPAPSEMTRHRETRSC